ncbi:MAG: HEAT repeat domain-containing protein [Myxococcales bacterium]
MSVPAFRTTKELCPDEPLASRVDALAQAGCVESSHVGYAGAPSEVYALFAAVREAASAAQLLSLAFHERPVVRLYAVRCLAWERPAELLALLSLLDDDTTVEVLDGCLRARDTVAGHLLCEVEHLDAAKPTVAAAKAALLTAALDRPALRDRHPRLLIALSGVQPAGAASRAPTLLDDPATPPAMLFDALAVWRNASPPSTDLEARLRAFAGHADAAVRGRIARTLGELGTSATLALLEGLRRDAEPGVAQAAESAYASHPLADPQQVLDGFRRAPNASDALVSLVHCDAPAVLAELVAYVRSHDVGTILAAPIAARRTTPNFTLAARELASFDAPGVIFGESPRSSALNHLVKNRGPAGAAAVPRRPRRVDPQRRPPGRGPRRGEPDERRHRGDALAAALGPQHHGALRGHGAAGRRRCRREGGPRRT